MRYYRALRFLALDATLYRFVFHAETCQFVLAGRQLRYLWKAGQRSCCKCVGADWSLLSEKPDYPPRGYLRRCKALHLHSPLCDPVGAVAPFVAVRLAAVRRVINTLRKLRFNSERCFGGQPSYRPGTGTLLGSRPIDFTPFS